MKWIGIIGSRRRDSKSDFLKVETAFVSVYKEGDRIVSGGCSRGGDRFAEEIAFIRKVPIKIYPAEWSKYGVAAGFIRNSDIAKRSDVLIACVAEDRKGGTEDTIKKFLKTKTKLILV